MQVNLRKANAIQSEIRKAIAGVKTDVNVAVTEYTVSIVDAMKKAGAYLLEPIQIHWIDMPAAFLSPVTKLVGGKRGQMLEKIGRAHV